MSSHHPGIQATNTTRQLGLIETEKEGAFYLQRLQRLQCMSLVQRLFAVFTPGRIAPSECHRHPGVFRDGK